MAYSLLDYLPRDVARRAPETQHLPGQFVGEAKNGLHDRVVRAVGPRAAAEHQASQAEHLLGNNCVSVASTRGLQDTTLQCSRGYGHFFSGFRLGFDSQMTRRRRCDFCQASVM